MKTLRQKDFALTLARGLGVLEAFSPERPVMTTSEIAKLVGISRAAARRLLLTLVALDYLESDGPHYRITPKIISVGHGSLVIDNKWQRITADVLNLSSRLNEPCSVSVLEGLNIVFVIRDQKRRIFSTRLAVGDKLPAHCSSAGKVLLASLEPDVLSQRLAASGPLPARTKNSITDPDALERELRNVRRSGWARADDEMEIGTISVGVPLFDRGNQVTAALNVSSHKTRRSMDELIDDYLPVIQDAAEQISDNLARGDR